MKRSLLVAGGVILLIGALLAIGLWFVGVIPLNTPSHEVYPVCGVDVSAYQGKIDWPTLAGQGIDFAFIKATEGSSHVDRCFADNYAGARQTSLRVGAYHFFSFDSPGETQAANFIATVAPFDGMLPPVVDVEFYGNKAKAPPDADAVRTELGALLDILEAHYGMPPILYTTEEAYARYLAGYYLDHAIWIRNVVTKPTLSDGRAWTFWQYSNRARLDGYVGDERYIDLNVFCGTREEFAVFDGITYPINEGGMDMRDVNFFRCYDTGGEWYLVEMGFDAIPEYDVIDNICVPEPELDPMSWQVPYMEACLNGDGTARMDTEEWPDPAQTPCRVTFYIYKVDADTLRTPFGNFPLVAGEPVPERLLSILDFEEVD